jgi:prepilin-type N-terminal cleavage/methylation domain-containing protein
MNYSIFKKIKNFRKNPSQKVFISRGFTMIELLVVVAIIGFLSSIVLSNVTESRKRADDAKRNQDLAQVKIALEIYSLGGQYPVAVEGTILENIAQLDANVDININEKYDNEEDHNQQKVVSRFFAKRASAQTVDPGCNRFITLAGVLVDAGLLSSVPRDPKHAPSNGICYKAWSDGSTITVYTYLAEKYKSNPSINKKAGIILSRNSEVTIQLAQSICTTTGNSDSNNDPYPVLNPNGTGGSICTGSLIADKILGVTSGTEIVGGDVVSGGGSCSDTVSTTQSECESDKSYCSDNSYTNQEDCESATCSFSTEDYPSNSCTWYSIPPSVWTP